MCRFIEGSRASMKSDYIFWSSEFKDAKLDCMCILEYITKIVCSPGFALSEEMYYAFEIGYNL